MTVREIQAHLEEMYGTEAIETVFPKTTVQLCIVHMVRNSLNYVSWKRRAEVAADHAVLSGPTQHQQEVNDADPRLEGRPEPLYDPVRGKTPSGVNRNPVYTEFCTPSIINQLQLPVLSSIRES